MALVIHHHLGRRVFVVPASNPAGHPNNGELAIMALIEIFNPAAEQEERSKFVQELREKTKADAKAAKRRLVERIITEQRELRALQSVTRDLLMKHIDQHNAERRLERTRSDRELKIASEKELASIKAEVCAQAKEMSEMVISDLIDGVQAAANAIETLNNQFTALQARVGNIEDSLRLMSSSKASHIKGKHR
jgi:hypothetical protein